MIKKERSSNNIKATLTKHLTENIEMIALLQSAIDRLIYKQADAAYKIKEIRKRLRKIRNLEKEKITPNRGLPRAINRKTISN